MKIKDFRAKLLSDPEFARLYCVPNTFELAILRRKAGLTQKQLAEAVGTKQSGISRLENNDEATTTFIGKVAYALGYVCRLQFIPLSDFKNTNLEKEK